MTISLSEFLKQLSNPALLITVLLLLGVIMVNGWTDAPNAINLYFYQVYFPIQRNHNGRCL